MKHKNLFCLHRWFLCILLMLPLMAIAQNTKTITGVVTDENNEPLIGVTVMPLGAQGGAVTDFDGKYSITIPQSVKQIQFSYVGYTTQVVDITGETLNITMKSDNALQEVVVIGYGVQKKTDLTGAITSLSTKDFNQGVITTPEELINGKISGVQIVNDGGSPTGGTTIRIRGGASLNATNDPLVVIDGVPMATSQSITGSGNPLSLVNPSDIETMTVLKDASSTAIYGSRASNGVILITTKKGSKKDKRPHFTFSTTNNVQSVIKTIDMVNGQQMKDILAQQGHTDKSYASAPGYGEVERNWSDEIFQKALGTDNNLSMSGFVGLGKDAYMPYRVSVGYMHQQGIVLNNWSQRATGTITVSPSFFDDYLKFNISLKGTINENRFVNTNTAIYNATVWDTYAPMNGSFLGYYSPSNADGTPLTGATENPVSILETQLSKATAKRFIGNVDVDYKLHFFPDIRVHATGAYDWSRGKGFNYTPAGAYSSYNQGGSSQNYGPQKMYNKLLTLYANYHKEIEGDVSHSIDFTAGYDYQYWKETIPEYYTYDASGAGQIYNTVAAVDERHSLLSYYGRLNYTLMDRYMLTATIRRDGSSRFAEGKKWGTFPSVALAYNIAKENFFKSLSKTINDLKVRVSYGVTGQQDGIANYGYMSYYYPSTTGAHYMFGNQAYTSYRPTVYNKDLTWETTKAFNVGLDFGFLNNRYTASIDFYTRKTEDLLATVTIPAGYNFNKEMLRNVGNVTSKGVEFSFNANVISTENWQWMIGGNATYQHNRITNLNGNNMGQCWAEGRAYQTFTEGYAPHTFYLYKQIYDAATGKPIEGMYADLNGDGKITEDDRYYTHHPAPDWIFGLTTRLTWKKWSLSTSLRANVGNYVYNYIAMNTGAYETAFYINGQMNMLNASYLSTNFQRRQMLSDHYLENASFIKMDNLQLSYNFGKISKYVAMNMSFMVQNVFTITKYNGIDPEVNGGFDNTIYPRPRTYSFTIGVEF